MSRNVRLVFAAKAARTLGYGALGVVFPVHLLALGFDSTRLGLTVTLTLLASAGLTVAVRRPAERFGARAALGGLGVLTILSALLFLLSSDPWTAVAAAMLGNLAVGVGETGPFLAVEQVVLSRAVPSGRLTETLSAYYLVGYAAAGIGAALVGAFPGTRPFFLLFLALSMLQTALYAGLTPGFGDASGAAAAVEAGPLVRRLAALFALDSFAGGFVVQSLVLYWFHARFGWGAGALGWLAFAVQAATGASFLFAPALARRFGLVPTMVFSHLVSNLFLAAVAFAPTGAAAAALLVLRHLLSQIDVPTRQSFLMQAVPDREREGAAALTTASRTAAHAASPALAGWVMGALPLGAPFLAAGGLKTAYDLMLWALARRVRLREDAS